MREHGSVVYVKKGSGLLSTLASMANLAVTQKDQGRRADCLALIKDCAYAQRRVLGGDRGRME
jgi:hypothetical protein